MTLSHTIRPVGPLNTLWCFIRNIHKPENWRGRCSRCGFSGLAHRRIVGPTMCIRFKEEPKDGKNNS